MFFYLQADRHLEDYFCPKKCGLSHFFLLIYLHVLKKNDSNLILKYISRKTKEVFWKVDRKNLNHCQEWKDAGLLFIWSKKVCGQSTVQISLSVYFIKMMLMKYSKLWKHIPLSKQVCILLPHFCKTKEQKYISLSLKGY